MEVRLIALLSLIGALSTTDAYSDVSFGDYVPLRIGAEPKERPWVTDLAVGDFSGDGVDDIAFCEGKLNEIGLLIGKGDGTFSESPSVGSIMGPAHIEVVDFDQDGDGDLLVACMGVVFPSNEKIGSVVILENQGGLRFKRHTILENTFRVTDVQAGDLDGDGDLDLSVAQFGYIQGEVQWLENLGNWEFRGKALLDLPGAIHSPIFDADMDGDLDIVSLISQQWEEVHLFRNERGSFKAEVVYGNFNEDFGISLADLDQDGDQDILYTNGDGFDYAIPGSRPWHGVQWLENDGDGGFKYHRVGDFSGAYSPIAVDVDQDGDLDIVASSCFNDWIRQDAYSLTCFVNDGNLNFTAVPLATEPSHISVVKAVDLDGDGIEELITGGFHAYPPWDKMSRITLWKKRKP
jgi:hypothetical protein